VLIPRPETEELVEWMLKEHTTGQRILDIGTGSGCIPVSLALTGHFSEVEAFDISEGALAVAAQNAELNQVNIRYSKVDILRWDEYCFDREWDIVVSNPPYVTYAEKDLMFKNVVEYEPHLALFVENNDPLLFYREIALFANKYLVPGGLLFFEINEQYGAEIGRLLEKLHYSSVIIRKDLSGKDRMIKAVKN
jgi:Methylase of polypeptide chain release factors